MKFLLVLFLALVPLQALAALPPEVERDRLLLHAKAALAENSYAPALDYFAQAQALHIALPESFALDYANALVGAGKPASAKPVLETYLNKYGTKGASYRAVLALLVQIEQPQTAAGGAATSAPKAATAAPSAARWGLADQDFSNMLGGDIAKKAGLPERRPEILLAAQAGDAYAQYLIGVSYLFGLGTNQDGAQYIAWITKASEQGLVRARIALGVARIEGKDTEQDMISGWTMLLQGANTGNVVGNYQVAMLTLRNGYKFIDRPLALQKLKDTAASGFAASQYALGHSYLETTDDQRKNLKLAKFWLEKAAAQGIEDAAKDLAAMPAP